MCTKFSFLEMVDKVIKKYDLMLSDPDKLNHCREFNALIFSMSDAMDILVKGLSGKFKWEE